MAETEVELRQRISELDGEVAELEGKVAELEDSIRRSNQLKAKVGRAVASIAWRIGVGRRLDSAFAAVFQRFEKEERPTADEYAYLAGAIVRRMLYVGLIGIVLAILPAIVAIFQTVILSKQNEILTVDARDRAIHARLNTLAFAESLTRRIEFKLADFTVVGGSRLDNCKSIFNGVTQWHAELESQTALVVYNRGVHNALWSATDTLARIESLCSGDPDLLDAKGILGLVADARSMAHDAQWRIELDRNDKRNVVDADKPE